jgi:dTDP-4-amino-4,6-dideoxygalactose transaminase
MSLVPGEDATDVRQAIGRVIDRGWFVLGPEVSAFEEEFAGAVGIAHAIGVGNGTDAIALTLRALSIGEGDEVITSPLSAAYSALAIIMAGARPVFADVDPLRATIDPERIAERVSSRTRAILPVHLYGQPADMAAIERVAARHGLAIVEDCCQAHLASSGGRSVGTFGVAGAFSFYPTKNLGALGDAGAVVTNDGALADRLRRLRNGGQSDRYHHLEPGINSRLDDLQAAVLRERLKWLPPWTARRRALAARYRARLEGAAAETLPERDPGHVYHLFVVTSADRDALQAHLSANGVETLIHYPIPIPRQPALAGHRPDDCPVAARLCSAILSLPLHPALRDDEVDEIVAAVHAFQPRPVVS